MPDGSVPSLAVDKWSVWVQDCISLLDGDGTFRHWKYTGAYADQPWIDLQIYRVIRGRWVELRNADMESKFKSVSRPLNKKALYGRKHKRR